MVVHFPLALLLTAVGLDAAAAIFRRPAWHHVALWNLALGTLAAGLAVFTGLRAEGVAKHSFEIWQVMQLHKRLGISTLILGLMATSWRLAHRDRLTPRARMVTLILGLMMAATLTWGADLGGRLVYGFGVGGTFGQ